MGLVKRGATRGGCRSRIKASKSDDPQGRLINGWLRRFLGKVKVQIIEGRFFEKPKEATSDLR